MAEVSIAREGTAMGLNARNAMGGRMQSANSFSARISRDTSTDERDRMNNLLGNSFVKPTYAYQAEDYKAATGRTLPQDAVQVVFGRGAANGSDFNDVISQPKYSHINVLEATTSEGRMTFLSGYKSTSEIRTLVNEVKGQQRASTTQRTFKSWNRRRGSIGGF